MEIFVVNNGMFGHFLWNFELKSKIMKKKAADLKNIYKFGFFHTILS